MNNQGSNEKVINQAEEELWLEISTDNQVGADPSTQVSFDGGQCVIGHLIKYDWECNTWNGETEWVPKFANIQNTNKTEYERDSIMKWL